MEEMEKPLEDVALFDPDDGELYGCRKVFDKDGGTVAVMEYLEPHPDGHGILEIHCADCYGHECPHWLAEKQIRPHREPPWGFTLDCHKRVESRDDPSCYGLGVCGIE